jgi:rare lipoprotein A
MEGGYGLRKLKRLVWVVLLAGAFLAMSGGEASADEALASWYGPGFEGRPTASGEIYDPYGYTAAHKTLPLGTQLVVSYGGRSVPVTVNDRGPYVGARELDLSQGAAEAIGLDQAGVDYVEYTYVGSSADSGYSEPAYSDPAPAEPAYAEPAYGAGMGYSETASVEPAYSEPLETQSYASPQAEVIDAGGTGYVVQPGDTLTDVAARLGTSVDYLARYNGLADPNLILSGETLYY